MDHSYTSPHLSIYANNDHYHMVQQVAIECGQPCACQIVKQTEVTAMTYFSFLLWVPPPLNNCIMY